MEQPEVTTTTGRVRGHWRTLGAASPSRSAVFLGIPYAEAPVGSLRFAAPVRRRSWDGVRDATAYGPTPLRGDPGITLIPEPSIPGDDTLNVNVFTPSPDPSAALPVLVWIHGGGYVSGSSAGPWFDGRAFTRDGVVLVSVSYRLGFEGFGWVGDGGDGNRAVRDWLLALEWVQENIRAFGGDPARVTIAGQSAGAGACLTLLGMPAAQHLFHAVWASSPAQSTVMPARARATSVRLAKLLGVDASAAGFGSVPEDRIRALQSKAAHGRRSPLSVLRGMVGGDLPYAPVVDGELIHSPARQAVASGVGGGKPLVLGCADDEFVLHADRLEGLLNRLPPGVLLTSLGLRGSVRDYLGATRGLPGPRTPVRVLGRFVTDSVFRAPALDLARRRTGPAPTWLYRFSWSSPARGFAVHCIDVPFFFDCLDGGESSDAGRAAIGSLLGDDPPQRLADAVHGDAVHFVREGSVGWSPMADQDAVIARNYGVPLSTDLDAYTSARVLLRRG